MKNTCFQMINQCKYQKSNFFIKNKLSQIIDNACDLLSSNLILFRGKYSNKKIASL